MKAYFAASVALFGIAVMTLLFASPAHAAGILTRRGLDCSYTKLFRNVYARSGVELTARDKAVAAWLWSGRSATLAGCSAAAVLGMRWLDPSEPAELIRPIE